MINGVILTCDSRVEAGDLAERLVTEGWFERDDTNVIQYVSTDTLDRVGVVVDFRGNSPDVLRQFLSELEEVVRQMAVTA